MSDTESSSGGCGVVLVAALVAALLFVKCSPSDGDVITTDDGLPGRHGYCAAEIDGIIRYRKIHSLAMFARMKVTHETCTVKARRDGFSVVSFCEEGDRDQHDYHPYCHCLRYAELRCD